jgi:hypothetical protein
MLNVFFNFEKDDRCRIDPQAAFHTPGKNNKEIRFNHKKRKIIFGGLKAGGNLKKDG